SKWSGMTPYAHICRFLTPLRHQRRWAQYILGAHTLLLGVGFNRCTSLHYAESLVPTRRTTLSRFPIMKNGERVWIESSQMAADNSVHFPIVGDQFAANGAICAGRVGGAD